ncbi:hypothetical protein ES319_A10G257500v1 [Gossypium barbadense]|uniref:KIB1-4 beta-propeller domain-containing protein n=1 Tax=Gossypium barbadense TaxID=3634 RepID=A0A5J5U7U4_GOSBA|nr:hypothetical protein ES319_A10G257500v1 [Gossypium barbadense]
MKQEKLVGAAGVSDWASIPADVLRYIVGMTQSGKDRFRMILKFPICLMLPGMEKSDNRCFYSISDEIFVELNLLEIKRKRCWGTPFGWLVTCGLDFEIPLFNPLSKSFLEKLILFTSPEGSGSNCIVLVIYTQTLLLAFAKPGDETWTPIDGVNLVTDAIYFKGNFYACRHSEYDEHEDKDEDEDEEDKNNNIRKVYQNVTIEFLIFKLDMHTKSWEKIISLGDSSLFVGNCCSFTIAAADYHGCRSICVYFTDDDSMYCYKTGGSDMGIYDCQILQLDINDEELNLDSDDLREPFPKAKEVQHLLFSSLCPPLWIIPFKYR